MPIMCPVCNEGQLLYYQQEEVGYNLRNLRDNGRPIFGGVKDHCKIGDSKDTPWHCADCCENFEFIRSEERTFFFRIEGQNREYQLYLPRDS